MFLNHVPFLEMCLGTYSNPLYHSDIRFFPVRLFPISSSGKRKTVPGAAGAHIIAGCPVVAVYFVQLGMNYKASAAAWSWVSFLFLMLLLLGHDQPLEQACRYFSEQGIPFPSIGLKDDEKNLKECYMFDGADTPGAPLLLYFPLVNDTFQRYVAPGKLTVPI